MKKGIVLAIGVLLVISGITTVSIAANDVEEPNNDFSHAKELKGQAEGSVGINDIKDVYKFYVAKGLEMQIEVTADNDVDLYLYNPEHKGIAYSCSGNVEFISYKADKSGYYYAEVVAVRGNSDYKITLNYLGPQNDAGYEGDAGNTILKAFAIFPNEIKDDTPGRGTEGTLSPPSDKDDWYIFSVCEGQKISITVTPTQDFDIELVDQNANVIATSSNAGTASESISYDADYTGNYYLHIYAKEGAGEGNYTMDISLQGQNDAGSNRDAGNEMDQALSITAGTYYGFLDANDPADWYSFQVSSGQGIFITLECPIYTDYNVWLYDPNGELVHEGTYYGDDSIEYPADVGGTWYIKVDIFPGWDPKWDEYPIEYYKYGSGAYTLTLSIGGSAEKPPVIPQPDITPVAQTFVVTNDENSNKDEYAYIAAIPAANYVENGKRYVSPIVYEGDDTVTNWFGTVDDTTNYLLEDWNEYLSHFGKEATVYHLDSDPVKAAANLATKAWKSSQEAVVVVDGSDVEDEVKEVLSKEATLNIQKKVMDIRGDDPRLKEFEGQIVYPFFVGKKWGAIKYNLLEVHGKNIDITLIGPKYREEATDWWPYDEDRLDLFHPVTLPGIWAAAAASSGDWRMHIELYSCHRYKIPVSDSDSTLRVTIETDEPTYLWVYLIDPRGNIVAPDIPSWNGAEIPPPGIWYGNKSRGDEHLYDHLVVEPATQRTVEVHHPIPGKYTAIVVPREDMTGSVTYRIKAEIREYSKDRLAYGLSAANGAVIASLKHIPLLYATPEGVPDDTINALNSLGVSKVIFVDLANNDDVYSQLSANYDVERITTMNDVVSKIYELRSQDYTYITVTSFATGDGYFAPAAYLAAYHGAPVVRIGEMGNAYHWGNVAHQWMFYAGDYYHGCRSIGHLPMASKPLMDYIKEGEIPPIGLDAELRWFRRIVEGVYNYVSSLGLNIDGIMEAYGFVAPKTDIRFTVHHALFGNESTAGQFIGKTPGEMAAQIARSVLYPAIIFANPYRNLTTSSLMNFQDGNQATGNDGKRYAAYTSRYIAQFFQLYGREYRGHCIWDNLLVEQSKGTSLYYYSGHGTGGSGVSYHPKWAGIRWMDGAAIHTGRVRHQEAEDLHGMK